MAIALGTTGFLETLFPIAIDVSHNNQSPKRQRRAEGRRSSISPRPIPPKPSPHAPSRRPRQSLTLVALRQLRQRKPVPASARDERTDLPRPPSHASDPAPATRCLAPLVQGSTTRKRVVTPRETVPIRARSVSAGQRRVKSRSARLSFLQNRRPKHHHGAPASRSRSWL
jgi:hypothetical protein